MPSMTRRVTFSLVAGLVCVSLSAAAADPKPAPAADAYQALLASASRERKRLLKTHGRAPTWPTEGDVATAPVWRFEVNLPRRPVTCLTYEFSGEKLTKTTKADGACP